MTFAASYGQNEEIRTPNPSAPNGVPYHWATL